MLNIMKLYRQKGSHRIILGIFLLICIFISFMVINKEEKGRMIDIFKKECVIESIDDIDICKTKNQYVKVRFDDAYNTTYAYFEGDKELAEYVDLDLEGYSLIALVNKSLADKILNQEQFYITGYLTEFVDVHKEALNQIKNYYKDELFEGEYSQEEIEILFLNTQIMEYDSSKIMYYILWIVLLGVGGIGIYQIICGIRILTSPKMTKWYQKQEDAIEAFNGAIDIKYQNKRVIITDFYIIENSFIHIKMEKLEDICWIYEKKTKQYGVTVNRSWIICFKNGVSMILPIKIDIDPYISKNTLKGYTKENIDMYRKIVKEFKGKNAQ